MLFRPTANKIFISMPDSVKLIECPRDAWQGLHGQIPADLKVDYLKALISAGFKHIDAASFVSPNAVPQMADSAAVLKELDPPDDVEIIGIVVNEKGAQRAINTQAVSTLGFPYSVCAIISGRRRKSRWRNWRRSRIKPTTPAWMSQSTSLWHSGILTAMNGTPKKS